MAMKEEEKKLLEKAARTRKGRNTGAAAEPINLSGYNRNIPDEKLSGRNKAANVALTGGPGLDTVSPQIPAAQQIATQPVDSRMGPAPDPTAAEYNEGTLTPEQTAVRNIGRQRRTESVDATKSGIAANRNSPEYQEKRAGLVLAQDQQPITAIRGTQQEQVALGDGGDGSDYQVYTGGVNDVAGRAASQADSIRRNVFSTPGESDAMAIQKRAGADRAAENYLNTTVGADVSREKNATTEKLGLANVGARYAGINAGERTAQANNRSRERIADSGGLSNAVDYTEMLEQGNAQMQLLSQQQQVADIEALNITQAEKRRRIAMVYNPDQFGVPAGL